MAPGGGLSAAEAAERLARFGPNELPRARRNPLWQLIADQVRDPLVMVLLIAAVLTVATGDLTDAGGIVGDVPAQRLPGLIASKECVASSAMAPVARS